MVDPTDETSEEALPELPAEVSEESRPSDLPKETSEDDFPENPDDTDDGEGSRRSRIGRFARRLIDRKEIASDTRDLLGSVLATSDKAKTEAVRLAAKEVRSYLDALALKEDVKALLTSYSLEISISLKPLASHLEDPAPEPEPQPDPEAELE